MNIWGLCPISTIKEGEFSWVCVSDVSIGDALTRSGSYVTVVVRLVAIALPSGQMYVQQTDIDRFCVP